MPLSSQGDESETDEHMHPKFDRIFPSSKEDFHFLSSLHKKYGVVSNKVEGFEFFYKKTDMKTVGLQINFGKD